MKKTLWAFALLLGWVALLPAAGQERRVQNRPYIDYRKFHYGFFVGLHTQGLDLQNNGYIDPDNGQQWFAQHDRTDLGFSVGVLGDWRLTPLLALRVVPTLHFGQKHVTFREQGTRQTDTQVLKSTYISVPVDLKFASPRFNNYRPYVLAGLAPAYDLTTRKQGNLLTKPFNVYAEVGLGCDFYLPFFKMIPELKFCFGLLDVLDKDRSALTDQTKLIYTQSVDKAKASMVVLSLYFE